MHDVTLTSVDLPEVEDALEDIGTWTWVVGGTGMTSTYDDHCGYINLLPYNCKK
jgi:hypothetical protein